MAAGLGVFFGMKAQDTRFSGIAACEAALACFSSSFQLILFVARVFRCEHCQQ
jgi:hypothetical protein